MNRFGLGITNQALLLLHIYPLERFLLDGRVWKEWEFSQNNKLVVRHRSLRSFQAYLGLSYAIKSSGEKTVKRWHGSSIVRSHLYAWAVCQICPQNYRVKSEVGRHLTDCYQELRQRKIKGNDAILRILFKMSRYLFKQLYDQIY